MLEKILISSKDPVRISLTIKGLAAFIPLILILTGFLGVNTVTELQLTNLVDSIADTVVADLSVIRGIVTILGIVPKVHPEQARYRITMRRLMRSLPYILWPYVLLRAVVVY